MAKELQPVKAKVAYIKNEETDQYDKTYKSVLFVDASLTDTRNAPKESQFWIKFFPQEYDRIPKKGEVRTLIPNSNGKGYSLLSDESIESKPNTTEPVELTPEKKKAIAEYANQLLTIRRYCLTQAIDTINPELVESMPSDIYWSHIEKVATGTFIDVKQKFNL